jgi:hypothetical protein
MLTAALVLGGAGLVAFSRVASPTVRALPGPFGYILFAGLFLSSSVSLWGVFWRSLAGSVVERSGLFAMALICVSFSFVVYARSGFQGLNFIVFMIAFAVANLTRVRQIGHEITEQQAVTVVLRQGVDDGLDI